MRDAGHVGQRLPRDQVEAPLELEVGHDREQVRVAGALAVAVGAALHVGGARLDRGQGVGHRAAGVVVAVDADAGPGADRLVDDVGQLVGEHPAVGVAQRDHRGARLRGGAQHLQRVRWVGLVAVEEVLGVEEDSLALRTEVRDRVADHREVLLESRAEGQLHVPVVALGDKGHDRRAGFAQCGHQWVVGCLHTGPAGRAERGELRVLQVELCSSPPEELCVLGIGPRPAPR
nr:hypothetical protein GCM10020093_055970 [Planobispora longispora]